MRVDFLAPRSGRPLKERATPRSIKAEIVAVSTRSLSKEEP